MTKLTNHHPLIGTWIADGEDSDAAFVIAVVRGRPRVSGFCQSDGERFRISRTRWDGETLEFEAFLPSTSWWTRHAIRLRTNRLIEHDLTLRETWKKKSVKPGKWPAAWGPPRRGSGKQKRVHPLLHVRWVPGRRVAGKRKARGVGRTSTN